MFLYETEQTRTCVSRLNALRLDVPNVACPQDVFESEGMIGVAVPAAPVVKVQQPELSEGESWYIGKTWLGQIIGLADSEQTLVRHGDLCGYLAPEILAWQSPPTLAADVYGIGAILFGYLAGMAPVDPFPTHHMQNKLIDAYESLDAALELDPGNPIVHHTRAEIFFLQGEPKWALKENERALSVDDSGTVHFLHGQCLVALADYANAERHLRQGLQKEESSRGRHVLASCLERAGQTKMAMLGRTE